MLMFGAVLALAEMPQAKLNVLEEKAYHEYEAHLRAFDPCSDDSLEAFLGNSYTFSVHDVHVEEFKHMILVEMLTGKKIWSG